VLAHGGARGTALRLAPSLCLTDEDCAREVICSYAWPCEQALSVARCESEFDPWAFNAGNYGWFQINAVHQARVDGNVDALFDPVINTQVAFALWLENGWSIWACKP